LFSIIPTGSKPRRSPISLMALGALLVLGVGLLNHVQAISGGTSPSRLGIQLARKCRDCIPEVLIASDIEQIVNDLLKGLAVNMPAEDFCNLAQGSIR